MNLVSDTPAAATERIDELDLQQWQRFVDTQPTASAFHTRNWLELMVDQYQMRPRLFVLCRDGQLVAGLPFLERRRRVGARILCSLPFTDFADVLALSPAQGERFRQLLAERSFADYRQVALRTDRYSLRTTPLGLVVHTLDTSRDLTTITSGYAASIRRNLRRAAKNGLEFAIRTDPESVDIFYELHVLTRRKLGMPVQPRSFFARLHKHLIEPRLGGVAVVTHGDRTLSAVVFLAYQRTLIYKYAASDPAGLDLRPNDLVVDGLIRHAVSNGYDRLEFGTSPNAEHGLRRFKSKWGARERPLFAESFRGPPQDSAHDSRAITFARAVIRRSPTIVCRGLGEAFYRFLS